MSEQTTEQTTEQGAAGGEARERVEEIMRATRFAMLTYVDEQGRLVSMPMGTQDFTDPGEVYFLTEADSDKVRAIAANPNVNVAYSSDDGWVSLAGTATRSDDRELLERLWSVGAKAFMEGGPENPDNVVLVVRAETAEYWTSGGKVATAVALAKSLLGDGRPDVGDSGTVTL